MTDSLKKPCGLHSDTNYRRFSGTGDRVAFIWVMRTFSHTIFGPTTNKNITFSEIRIIQSGPPHSTHGGGCFCKKSIRIRTNLWCNYVNFFWFFGSVRTNLWMMWDFPFGFPGRSWIMMMMWMNCWTPCWSSLVFQRKKI